MKLDVSCNNSFRRPRHSDFSSGMTGGKNMQTLLDLDITPRQRKEIIMQLEVSDYVDGPLEDTLYKKGEMWVFGKEVKHNDVYIKIPKGLEGRGAFCISFHVAEHPLKYKFK